MNRLDGKRLEFFGVNENCFQVREQGSEQKRIFEAIEDPSDGYRSSLKELKEIAAEEAKERNLFFNETPFAVLWATEVEKTYDYGDARPPTGVGTGLFRGLQLIDDGGTGHIWLSVGTCNDDDYYPGFVFSYTPPAVQP